MAEELHQLEELICTYLKNKKRKELHDCLANKNATDIAEAFEELWDNKSINHEELMFLFRILPKDMASDTFVEMSFEMQESLINGFNDTELRDVINDLYLDDTVDIIEEMPAFVVKRILKNVSAETRVIINQLLNYPENSAGSIMTIEYIDFKKNMTVEDAFKRIRRIGLHKETVYTCYVIDEKRKLIGLCSVKDLLLADYKDKIEDIMEENVISVQTTDDQEIVAEVFSKYGFMALPVVDLESRLVGIITVDDAIEVIKEEHAEDIEKMGAVISSDKEYLKMNVFEIWKARIPWLLFLMVSATFTGLIISKFENALATQVVLVAYIPMLMDTGGNSGSQASVTLIRGLSLGEIEYSDIFKVIFKEFQVAIVCGITLAIANFFKLLFFDKVSLIVSLTVNLTLLITVIVAKLVGGTLPLISKKIGFDPAVMSAPFITTIVDAISLIVYFNIAHFLLHI